MAKELKTPLQLKFDQLPIGIGRKRFVEEVVKAGISERTFDRDMEAASNSIPIWRMQVYSGLFGLGQDISELIDTYVKIKPIIKRPSIAKQIGLKS